MTPKLEIAIRNNNDLYVAIFEPHQIESHLNRAIWYCLQKTPPLYSNLVTISRDWRPDEIFRRIEERFKIDGWEDWSVKDSFAALDLTKLNFRRLFDAKWLYLQAEKFESAGTNSMIKYKFIADNVELSKWRIAWDANERLGIEIFDQKLLDNAKLHFVAGYESEAIITGCLVNKTGDVLGISNFFAPDTGTGYRSDLIQFIHESIEFAGLVGYERNDIADNLQSLGFEAVGNLTVWLKNQSL